MAFIFFIIFINPELKKMLDFAEKNNPQIKSLQSEYSSKLLSIPPSSSLPDPEFMISTRTKNMVYEIGLRQQIPFPPKLKKAREISEASANISFYNFQVLRLKILYTLSQRYIELLFAKNSLNILSEIKKIYEDILKNVSRKYSVGEADLKEISLIMVKISDINSQIIEKEKEIEILKGEILYLLGGEIQYDYDISIKEPREENLKIGDGNLLILQPYKEEVKLAEKEFELSKLQYFPDFSFGPQIFTMEGGMIGVGLSVGFSFPLFWFQKQKYYVLSAEKNLLSKKFKLQDVENELKSKTLSLQKSLSLLYKDVSICKERTNISKLNFSSYLSQFLTGKVGIIDTLIALQDYNVSLIEFEEKKKDFWITLSEICFLEGIEPEKCFLLEK